MLDDGVYGTVTEIGDAENISKSYVSRILRLALLAPAIVEGILAGTTDQAPVLEELERPLPASWDEQRRLVSTGSIQHSCGSRPTDAAMGDGRQREAAAIPGADQRRCRTSWRTPPRFSANRQGQGQIDHLADDAGHVPHPVPAGAQKRQSSPATGH
jgi:hypothetical protein